jgi:D-alanyl-D-alanine carboxypeptidase (penicillin-binding protein 5/6)
MTFSRGAWLGLAFACLLPLAAQAASAARSRPTRPNAMDNSTAYKGAILLDAATGNVLFEDRADTVTPPASMTKLMTFAVLHDLLLGGQLTLQTPVTVTARDSRMGGTQVWLKEGEVFPVEDLIYAMMVQSANDASHALARTAGGSIEAFVGMMNAKARELGMTKTTFRTPHGLPASNRRVAEGDLTTPRDFSLLCQHLVRHTEVLKYTNVKLRDFGPPVRAEAVKMDNHNNLLGKIAGVDGLKTGFTNGAGFCLSATAQRGGRRVIVVMMGSPDSNTRDLKVGELIERGFAQLPPGRAPVTNKSDSPLTAPPATATPAAPANSDVGIKFSVPKKK